MHISEIAANKFMAKPCIGEWLGLDCLYDLGIGEFGALATDDVDIAFEWSGLGGQEVIWCAFAGQDELTG